MSENDKSLRLLKVAKELNIATVTVTEYLASKGFQVENKPTAKISEDMYDVLLKEFQGDKTVKEEAKQITIGKIRREEILAEESRPARQGHIQDEEGEEILIKNISTGTSQPELNQPSAPRREPETHKETSKDSSDTSGESSENESNTLDEGLKQNQELNSEIQAPLAALKPVGLGSTPEKESSQAEMEADTNQSPHLKIVGKIDLDLLKQKGKPLRKAKEDPAIEEQKAQVGSGGIGGQDSLPQSGLQSEDIDINASRQGGESESKKVEFEANKQADSDHASAAASSEESLNQQKSAPEASMPPTEATSTGVEGTGADSAAAKPDEEPSPDKERISTVYQKLSGPNIIGKIELPAARKSQPVASSASPIEQARKKRKRKDTPGHGQPSGGPGYTQTGSPNDRRPPHIHDPNRPPAQQRPPFKKDDRVRVSRDEPTEKEIQDQIKATLARLSGAGKSGKFAQRAKLRRQKRDDVATSKEEDLLELELQSKILKVTEYVTANELAKLMDVPVNQIISTCMSLGLFVSINQRLDAETLTIVAEEFGYQVDFVSADNEVVVEEELDKEEDLLPRAPIVTVMGHVDHGKTSLLDYIRKANVIEGEAGGITQHIGAYEVKLENGKKITFLDTPGHEAFTAMRARGAQSTDIVIIVIAADDAVMPQTVEAINHSQAAGVPMVFAFNKMDRPGANPEKIREQLSAMNILVEEWGGKFQTQEISAKKGENVDVLLEKVLLEAELLDLKANPSKRAVGSVIEAALDKGRGIVTTVLVQAGTLRVGDPILAGCYSGRVKAMFNERQQKVAEAGPSAPVLVLGMQGSPQAGDRFFSMETETEARDIANKRLQLQREQGIRTQKHITLDEIGRRLAIGNFKELNIIVKGDVDGSIEALSDSLLKLSTTEIQINVLHKSVGQISESDVLLASASDAIIIGFQVRPSLSARKLAEQEQIDIRLYSIIYDAINEIKSAMEGMLSPVFEEKIVCNVEVRDVFKITKVGTIAGCYVLDGKITRNTKVRIVRDGVVIHSGELDSLKRFKDDVKEVAAGYECGLNIRNYNNIEVGDVIEGYEQVEVKRKL